MPSTVHLYVFDGYADWEPAFAVAGIHQPQFQRDPGRWQVRTVADQAGQPVRSMGGVAVLPDLALSTLDPQDSALLILPGGLGWEGDHAQHSQALARARAFVDAGVPVAAICGATAGLAREGLLDGRRHTSNALTYLKGTGYQAARDYADEAAVCDGGVITAGGMAPLEFAREIFSLLDIYEPDTLEAWFQLNKTGKSEYFARMARSVEHTDAA